MARPIAALGLAHQARTPTLTEPSPSLAGPAGAFDRPVAGGRGLARVGLALLALLSAGLSLAVVGPEDLARRPVHRLPLRREPRARLRPGLQPGRAGGGLHRLAVGHARLGGGAARRRSADLHAVDQRGLADGRGLAGLPLRGSPRAPSPARARGPGAGGDAPRQRDLVDDGPREQLLDAARDRRRAAPGAHPGAERARVAGPRGAAPAGGPGALRRPDPGRRGDGLRGPLRPPG